MNFNSNTLFHYTNTVHKLSLILRNGFFTSYSKEFILGNGIVLEFAVPIISFCDIPLSNISDHVKKYGNYAIGVSKEFAIGNSFSKVFYTERFSDVTEGIFDLHQYAVRNFAEKFEERDFEQLNDGVLRILQVIKNNVGPLKRHEGIKPEYEFFKEMEWRYTPLVAPNYKQVYADFEELAKDFPSKPHLPQVRLTLGFKDINWIIVKTNKQIPGLINVLKKCKNLYNNNSELEILMTKIFSLEKIKNDL